MGSFVDARIAQTPRWLRGAGLAYQQAQGQIQDDETDLFKAATKLRAPYPIAPIDALDMQGEEARILRAPGEADESYAARLRNKFELWYWAGTSSGLANIFAPFAPAGTDTPPSNTPLVLDRVLHADLINDRRFRGETSPEVIDVHEPGASTFAFFFGNTEFEGFWFGVNWFSLVYGIIDSSMRFAPWAADGDWDDAGDWDDGGLWDITMTEAEAKYIRQMIRRWKAASAYPVTIAIALIDDDLWDMPGDWDDGGNWIDCDPPTYLTIGHVWGEEEWLGDGLVDLWDDDPGETWDAFVDPLKVP
jgi:hypothetical protein